jgi:serine/threonine-protein kinase
MLAVGTVLEDKYRIVRAIGEGGMGVVYEAEHAFIGRRLAVKMLHPEYSRSQEVIGRFHREAQAASRIGHVNIIEITDMGVTAGGAPYIVMEYLEGESFAALLGRERRLPVRRAADIVGQTLGALAAAHAKGIVHRDIKPDNVFLIDHGGRTDFVKLLDFGISKVVSGASGLGLTRTGTMLGTPYYMAPEQAMGRSDVDHRVDVYAAGAVLFEALAGCRAYDGANYNELLARIITTDPPPLGSIRPDCDPGLEAVVARAMARDPAHRYGSAAEMLEGLLPFGASRTPFERSGRRDSMAPSGPSADRLQDAPALDSAVPPPERSRSPSVHTPSPSVAPVTRIEPEAEPRGAALTPFAAPTPRPTPLEAPRDAASSEPPGTSVLPPVERVSEPPLDAPAERRRSRLPLALGGVAVVVVAVVLVLALGRDGSDGSAGPPSPPNAPLAGSPATPEAVPAAGSSTTPVVPVSPATGSAPGLTAGPALEPTGVAATTVAPVPASVQPASAVDAGSAADDVALDTSAPSVRVSGGRDAAVRTGDAGRRPRDAGATATTAATDAATASRPETVTGRSGTTTIRTGYDDP